MVLELIMKVVIIRFFVLTSEFIFPVVHGGQKSNFFQCVGVAAASWKS